MTQREIKTGVLGGTFDPVHLGHLLLAESAREEIGLDQVLFMPVHIQPFKIGEEICSPDHRLAMLNLAVRGNPFFSVIDVEICDPGVSYTIHSLRKIHRQQPDPSRIFFILGADAFLNLETWYEADSLLREFSFLVGVRPGYRNEEIERQIEHLGRTHGTCVQRLRNEKLDVSSSEIRRRITEGRSTRYLVPDAVRQYIDEHHIYRQEE